MRTPVRGHFTYFPASSFPYSKCSASYSAGPGSKSNGIKGSSTIARATFPCSAADRVLDAVPTENRQLARIRSIRLLVLCHPCSDVFGADLLLRGIAVGGGS